MKDFNSAAQGSPLERNVKAFHQKYDELMTMAKTGLMTAYKETWKHSLSTGFVFDDHARPVLQKYNPDFFERLFNPRHLLRRPVFDRMIKGLDIKTRNGHSCSPIDRECFFGTILPQLSTSLTSEGTRVAGKHYAAKNRIKRTPDEQKIIDGALALKALINSDFGQDYMRIMDGIAGHELTKRQAHRARFERRCAARQKDAALRAQNAFAAATKRLGLVLATPHLAQTTESAPALTA